MARSRLAFFLLSLLLSVASCGDDDRGSGCPTDTYPATYDGELDTVISRAGDSSTEEIPGSTLSLFEEIGSDGEPTGRYELRLGWCDFVIEPVFECSVIDDAGQVSLLLPFDDPEARRCEWTTAGGDVATWQVGSSHFWWSPDYLDIQAEGAVTFAAPDGSTDSGTVRMSFYGLPL